MKTTYEGLFKCIRVAVAGMFVLIIALPALTSVGGFS